MATWTDDVAAAAAFIERYGHGDNCLTMSRERFDRAVETVRAAPPAMICGGLRIICRIGGLMAYRDVDDPSSWGCHFIAWQVGAWDQVHTQYVLGEGKPSKVVHGTYHGRRLLLNRHDAAQFGVVHPSPHGIDDETTRDLFGSNIQTV